ncbi:excisionase family DNA binding protein [Frigoribacterium sp. PhB24]|nr:excisionase family DNA binding protein [Frigoribacterium sp. PhB24]
MTKMLESTVGESSCTLGATEVGAQLGLSAATINAWAKTNRMPAYRIRRSWLVLRVEFEAWVASTSTVPGQSSSTWPDPLASLPPYLSLNATAKVLRVSVPTLGQMLTQGDMPHLDLGSRKRISLDALRTFLDSVRNDGPRVL